MADVRLGYDRTYSRVATEELAIAPAGRAAGFGFIWGFLFGWIMNIWVLLSLPDAFSWRLVAVTFAASFYFDLAHALSNVFFLAVLAGGWTKVLQRFRKKYGLLQE